MLALLEILQGLEPSARSRVIAAAQAFFGMSSVPGYTHHSPINAPSGQSTTSFSEDRSLSPKEFLLQKRPSTDVERIAALAYYLAHYRATPHFKTLDLSKLNTEAAQLKLSNAANAVDNATRAGLLVPASKGAKQLSALGELYVEALPDRAAARQAVAHNKPRRKPRKAGRSDQEAPDTERSE